ncbi:MAG: hypothetical protein NVSMB16_14060 [Acidimicrobiales bacterium]
MTIKTQLILSDPACGTERSYEGLRLAGALAFDSADDRNHQRAHTGHLASGFDGWPGGG